MYVPPTGALGCLPACLRKPGTGALSGQITLAGGRCTQRVDGTVARAGLLQVWPDCAH